MTKRQTKAVGSGRLSLPIFLRRDVHLTKSESFYDSAGYRVSAPQNVTDIGVIDTRVFCKRDQTAFTCQPPSSSASRFTAGAGGFLTITRCAEFARRQLKPG